MAQACTIPCNARAMRAVLQQEKFGDELFNRLPVIGVALLIGIAGIALLPVIPVASAAVVAGWGFIGAAVVAAQAWLAAGPPAYQAMPAELVRLVEVNTTRMHAPRVADLQKRVSVLSLGQPNFDLFATRVLQDLREATGEAWRCPCRKRRLPLPF
jgi:hypothetical protein